MWLVLMFIFILFYLAYVTIIYFDFSFFAGARGSHLMSSFKFMF